MQFHQSDHKEIKNKIEETTNIKLGTWYFKEGCKSLKFGFWITKGGKIALRYMQAGEQSKRLPSMPSWWSLSPISYYTTVAGALKRVVKLKPNFKGYKPYKP